MAHTLFVRMTLGATGFILGIVGVASYAQSSISEAIGSVLRLEDRTQGTPTLAQASCTTSAAEDDIVFLSCGGMF